jgi:hypothetical protein
VLNKPSLEFAELYSCRSDFWRLGLSGVFLVVSSRWKDPIRHSPDMRKDGKDDEIYDFLQLANAFIKKQRFRKASDSCEDASIYGICPHP